MDEKDSNLYRYLIQITATNNSFSKESPSYRTNSRGEAEVSVYKVLEGNINSFSDVGHIIPVGWFPLKNKSGKTLDDLMQEIREGLSKIISSQSN
jgi:hypothetical protein